MNNRQRIAQILIALGCLVILAGSALHLLAAYPQVAAVLSASNLSADIKNAMRAVFLMIALNWIVMAVITLIATFVIARTSKGIILFSGFSILVQIAVWVRMMGWFVGNEMFLVAAGLIVCGGFLFEPTLSSNQTSSIAHLPQQAV